MFVFNISQIGERSINENILGCEYEKTGILLPCGSEDSDSPYGGQFSHNRGYFWKVCLDGEHLFSTLVFRILK